MVARVLLIAADSGDLKTFEQMLSIAGCDVLTASSGLAALKILARRCVDLVMYDLKLQNIATREMLQAVRVGQTASLIIATDFANATAACDTIREEARKFMNESVNDDAPTVAIGRTFVRSYCDNVRIPYEAHAAARWARTVVRIVESPKDLRTIGTWARWIAVSTGALRNWCRTAGISPRRSLVLGRMLRAICLSEDGRSKPQDLLDVADLRTLCGLLISSGFGPEKVLPTDPYEFLALQTLVREPAALVELRRVLEVHVPQRHARARAAQR